MKFWMIASHEEQFMLHIESVFDFFKFFIQLLLFVNLFCVFMLHVESVFNIIFFSQFVPPFFIFNFVIVKK